MNIKLCFSVSSFVFVYNHIFVNINFGNAIAKATSTVGHRPLGQDLTFTGV